ncbi:hypothetical protein niasHT_035178 [Heterodera trifolii]|uniref:Uncharacterized protein n=1 Tax=Heterodera trifolii TaxID=157864 RepID=A0ABD2IWQ4_9BILA
MMNNNSMSNASRPYMVAPYPTNGYVIAGPPTNGQFFVPFPLQGQPVTSPPAPRFVAPAPPSMFAPQQPLPPPPMCAPQQPLPLMSSACPPAGQHEPRHPNIDPTPPIGHRLTWTFSELLRVANDQRKLMERMVVLLTANKIGQQVKGAANKGAGKRLRNRNKGGTGANGGSGASLPKANQGQAPASGPSRFQGPQVQIGPVGVVEMPSLAAPNAEAVAPPPPVPPTAQENEGAVASSPSA